jgi:glycosidase
MRPRIYLLHPRQFSNTNETRKPNGTLAENGVGKFNDLNHRALLGLRELGITHLWLLGVLRQATGTGYPDIGLPADDPDLLKGIAGSPFAVRDSFDVCPDYAQEPARRLEEFQALIGRVHQHGMKVLIDFIPNHVARSHRSVVRPDLEFGEHDDRSRFFVPGNHFYHLPGQGPLRLPTVRDGHPVSATCQVLGGCDGMFEGESDQARVTGNNVISPAPGLGDWYETVKLNYGHDFSQGRNGSREFPTSDHPEKPIPNNWLRMDAVLAHWQALGVDGFRCDMAHMIPMEFWHWAIRRARERRPDGCFIAEAYDDDPNKLTNGNVLRELVGAGFDAVYDHQAYQVLKGIHDGPKWANDLDAVLGSVAPLHQSVRYAENHDEVRIAHPRNWGGLGPQLGLAMSALLFGLGRGPLMIYSGQEVGEPAQHAEGFGGGEGRTSIFDYGSMPELARWVNHHRYDGGQLTDAQRTLRAGYARLLTTLDHPALAQGEFVPLNPLNLWNPRFGQGPGEAAGGHWLYAWLRHHAPTGRTLIGVVNLHGRETLRNVSIRLPEDWVKQLRLDQGRLTWTDVLGLQSPGRTVVTDGRLHDSGLEPGDLEPMTALYLEPRQITP